MLTMTPNREACALPEVMTAVRDEWIAVLVGCRGSGIDLYSAVS